MKLLVAGLSLLVAIQGSMACSCQYQTDTTKYCTHNYVLKVKALGNLKTQNDPNNSNAYYKVEVLTTYKPSTEATFTRLYTGANGGLCGILLAKNKEYIVSGNYVETHSGKEGLRVSSCQHFNVLATGTNSELQSLLDGTTSC